MRAVVVLLPVAWAIGTFPTAVLVARARGHDVLAEGSGNPGASNVLRLLGVRWFVVVMAVDLLKGAAAAGVGLAVGGRAGAYALGAAAVLGHTFPLWRRGGKGVATAGGMLLVLFPVVVVASATVWTAIVLVSRKASLASLVIIVGFPPAAWALGHDPREVAILVAMAVLLLVRHGGNIRRLVRGEEHEVGSPERP